MRMPELKLWLMPRFNAAMRSGKEDEHEQISNQYLGWQGLYSNGGNSQIIVNICCNSLSTPANTTGFFDRFLFHEQRNWNHILYLRSCGRSPAFCLLNLTTTGPRQNAATSPKRSLWPRKSSKALRMKDHPKIRPGGVSRPTGWLAPCFYRFLGLNFHLETDPMWWRFNSFSDIEDILHGFAFQQYSFFWTLLPWGLCGRCAGCLPGFGHQRAVDDHNDLCNPASALYWTHRFHELIRRRNMSRCAWTKGN